MKKSLLILTMLFLFFVAPVTKADVSIIVHPANAATSLTTSEVKKIYLGRMRELPSGGHVTAFDQKEESKTRQLFYKIIVGKTAAQLNAYWSIQIFSGKAVPPRTIGSDKALLEKIKSDKNAIGYIDSKLLTNSVKEVLRIK